MIKEKEKVVNMRMGRKLGASKLFQTKDANKKLMAFNKQWEPGKKFRVLYPVFWDEEGQRYELMAGAIWGYNWDLKATNLKRVFLKTVAPINENGDPEYKDELAQMVPIARLLYKGQQRKEEREIEENPRMKEAAKITAINKIKVDYNGDDNGLNRIHQPLIGKLDYKIFTECVMIPMDDNDVPDFSKAILVSQDLSNSRFDEISTAINDKKCYVDKELEIAEVAWNFVAAADKSASGRKTTPAPVEESIALIACPEGSTEARKLQQVTAMSKARLLPENSDIIIKRNINSKETIVSEVVQAFKEYCTSNYKAFEAVDEEADLDLAERNIEALCKYEVPIASGSIAEMMDAYIAKKEEEENNVEEETEGASGAPTLDEISKKEAYTKEELEEIKKNASEGLGDSTVDAGLSLENDGTDITQM